MSDMPTKPGADDDPLARIIRLAGRRPVAADDVRARVYASAHAQWRRAVTEPRRRVRQWWLAAAATAALAAVVAGAVLLRTPDPGAGAAPLASVQAMRGSLLIARDGARDWHTVDGVGAALRAGDALRTPPGARAAIALGSAASLRLNEGTELLLLSVGRLNLSHGTIYLDTGADAVPARAVHVTTPLGEVWDVGTQFELRSDAGQLRIRVREGAVEFQGQARDLRSGAGDELLIPAHGKAVRGQIAPYAEAWSWVTDLTTFGRSGDYSAATLLQWVSRETGRKLQFDSPATAAHAQTLLVHGAEDLSPAETLDVVAATTDLRCDVEGTEILVHIATP
jgi:ferric-dicitrate binding protein FerR (iron transport regulator)